MISKKLQLIACVLLGLSTDLVRSNSQWILGEKDLSPDAYLYKSFVSKVHGGENVTYQLTSGGSLELVLKSDSGDADIYIGSQSKPTTDDYDESSVTCATDSVHIAQDMPRPVHISIFGSPYHEVSAFTLDVYLVPPKTTYEDIYRSNELPSYEDLVYEHVQLRDEHLRGIGEDGGRLRPSSSSSQQRRGGGGQGRGDGRGGGGGVSSDGEDGEQGWVEWFLDGDEGWVAVITIITGILKVLLQILG